MAVTARAAFLLLFHAATGVSQEEPSTFPAGTELVTVDAVVVDPSGAPVLGLTAADFTVAEDGAPQEVVAFEAVHRPVEATAVQGSAAARAASMRTASNVGAGSARGFVFIFDELHLDTSEAQRARAAIAGFLETALGSRDHVTVVGTYAGTQWSARLPEGREALVAALERFQGRRVGERAQDAMTDFEAMRIDRDNDPIVTDRVLRRFVANRIIVRETRLRGDERDRGESLDGERSQVRARAAQVYARTSAQNETTLGILERSVASLTVMRGRKSLILVSGGVVHDPRLAGFRKAVTEARRANVAIYFLDARGLGAAPTNLQADLGAPLDFNDLGATLQEGRETSEGSEGLAADTGGFSIRNTNDLADGLRRIARESESYYLLGYSPSNKRADGRFRKIEVKVAREAAVVRARRGYFAPGGERDSSPKAETGDAALQRALDSPFDLPAVPLRATAHVLGEAEPGQARVLVTTEADIRSLGFEERGGQARDTLEYMLVVAERASGEFHRFDQQFAMSFRPETRSRFTQTWFPITRELKLRAGAHQARIVARDKNSGRVGSLTYDFEVPPSSGLRVSTPILSDRLREEPGGGKTPEPIARRTFAPSGVLHCRFEVYGAGRDAATGRPDVTAGFSVRRSDGRFLTAAAPTPLVPGPDGTLARALGLPLDDVPAGSYELIVVVTDIAAGAAAEVREPFVIEPAGD
jgi:VWFA-related protein